MIKHIHVCIKQIKSAQLFNIILKIHLVLFGLLLTLLFACNNKDIDDNNQEQILDTSIVKRKVDDNRFKDYSPEDTTEPRMEIILRDSVQQFYKNKIFALPKQTVKEVTFNPSTNPQELLAYSLSVKSRVKKVALYRQALTLIHYQVIRNIDTVKYLSDYDLLAFLTLAFNADIYQNPLDLPKTELDSIIADMEQTLCSNSSYAKIISALTDFFKYQYISYEFNLLQGNVLEFNYNAGGMAGSAEKVYYKKDNGSFKKINFDPISVSISNIMEKTLKQMAYVDIGRFPIILEWNAQENIYTIQFYIQSEDAASCCPRYITRFKTKDLTHILRGSLQYATTEHISEPHRKAVWIDL
jgi:hypothetical protein